MKNKRKNNIVVIFSSHLGDEKNSEFINHIHKTIGTKHKVVCYPNYGQYSLSEVYNKAIDEHIEKDCIFLMCHPDIIIKTQNWGKILLNHFNNTKYSIIGVAGSTFVESMWWQDRTKMVGIVEHTDDVNTWVSEYSNKFNGVKSTVNIDGLFMAFDPNDIIHKFNLNYGKYHFYDLVFSVENYLDGVDIGVTTSIRVLHKSVGQTNQSWEDNRIKFANEYKDELPISILPIYSDIDVKLTDKPKVSVVIPTKNNLKYIRNNINSWNEVVKYDNYEIIIADTGSSDDVINGYSEILSDNVKLIMYDYYNFAKINNDVVKNHVGKDTEIVVFCNDDVKLINDVLSRCVEIYNLNKNSVGTIGIRLHFGDGSVQHNGISILRDVSENIHLTHVDLRKPINYNVGVNYNSFGNTGAFLFINKELFMNIGCFNENYIECFEDVELNLNCLLLNLKNITISDAVAYHYESISRDKSKDKIEKLNRDYFERLHPFYLKNKEKLNKLIKLIK